MSKALLCVAGLFIIIVIGHTVIVAQPGAGSSAESMKAPVAKKEAKVLKIHGYEIVDNYAWLRDRNKEKDPAIIQYLKDNNAYTETFMGKHQPFVDALYKEMLGRIKQDDTSVPYKLGDFWYFNKTEEGKQYPVYLRSKTRDLANPEVLLDQNEMAKGHEYYAISDIHPSDDGNLLAFAIDTTGYRQYLLQIKDLRTGQLLPDKIERVTSAEWSNDSKYLFVGQEDPVSKRSDKIWRHEVGTDKNDLLFEEKDVLFNAGVSRSRDKKMLFINSYAKTMREAQYLPADNPTGDWKVLAPRRAGHEYSADYDSGEFYFVTNKDGAENFKVMKAPASDPSEKSWTDFIPYDPNVKIDGVDFFKDYAAVSEVENGLEYVRVMDRKTKRAPVRIPTPESVYTMGLANNPEYDTPVIRYGYSSMITPNSTYEFDLKARESKLVKQQ
ncbi:MAG TPA: hypothetical protein VEV84_01535 [Pyrinomonadaceae bacterium]|nr:hypothetical protein [Pyrinomonadaceae bacterium]